MRNSTQLEEFNGTLFYIVVQGKFEDDEVS